MKIRCLNFLFKHQKASKNLGNPYIPLNQRMKLIPLSYGRYSLGSYPNLLWLASPEVV
jgi:hypothetical protein